MRAFTFPMCYHTPSGSRIGQGTVSVPEVAVADAVPVVRHENTTYLAHGGRLWMPSLSFNGIPRHTARSLERAAVERTGERHGWADMIHSNPFIEDQADHAPTRDYFRLSRENELPVMPVDTEPMTKALARSPQYRLISEQAARTILVGEAFYEMAVGPVLGVRIMDGKPHWTWMGGTSRKAVPSYSEDNFSYRDTDLARRLYGHPHKVDGRTPEVLAPFDDGFDPLHLRIESAAFSALQYMRVRHLGDTEPALLSAVVAVRRELEARLPGRELHFASPYPREYRHFSEIAPDATALLGMLEHLSDTLGYGGLHQVEPVRRNLDARLRDAGIDPAAEPGDNEVALAAAFG